MRRALSPLEKITALSGVTVMIVAIAVLAHPSAVGDAGYNEATTSRGANQPPRGVEAHNEVANKSIGVVSKLKMSGVVDDRIADVSVHRSTAYLAARDGQACEATGVHVVDIADVAAPREIAFIPAEKGSYPGEGVQALTISTPAFSGDILVTNNEKCKQPGGFGGINIYGVSNPAAPEVLTQGFGDDTGNSRRQSVHQTHSVFAWQEDSKAYAVMVDNEESADVDIVDITDPRRPVLVTEYDLAKQTPQILQPNTRLDEVFLHDVIVKEINGRQIMLASYWDGGYVQLDVTGIPTTPVYLSDSDFPNPDSQGKENNLFLPDRQTAVPAEGNAHQAEFTRDNRFVIGADADFAPFRALARNVSDNADLLLSSGSGTKHLEPGQGITGQARFGGRACNTDPAVPAGNGTQIAVVERGICTFTEKVANIEKAGGYLAAVIFNRTGAEGCNNVQAVSLASGIPTFGVAPRQQGLAMFGVDYDDRACIAGNRAQLAGIDVGAVGDTLTFGVYFDGWGYVRLLDASTMQEVDTYAIAEGHDIAFADDRRDLSVHEVATSHQRDDLAFLSYYTGGLRAITVGPAGIEEVGAFIDESGNDFWGVEIFTGSDGKEYVAASDRDFGLYIFQYR